MRIVTSLAAGMLAAGMAGPAFAGGFYLQEQSVRGAARAYSGEVSDTGVQSLWWNPAAIARSPRQAYVAAHAVLVDADVTDTGSSITYPGGITLPVGGEPRAFKPIQDGVAPNLAVAMPVGGRFAVGLSVAALSSRRRVVVPTAIRRPPLARTAFSRSAVVRSMRPHSACIL
jgi:long-chain fatty acid transport protein